MSTGVIESAGRVGSAAVMPPYVPVSTRILEDFRHRIESGELKPGTKLPSISDLMTLYDCSDTPVKAALLALKTLGLIEGRPGKGSFVAERPTR